MRTPFALLLSTAAVAAQQGDATLAAMERLSTAVGAIERALADGDRAARTAPLDAIERALDAVAPDVHRDPRAAAAAVAAIRAAVADLRDPVGDGAASDPWDFARLRRACTECHLRNRRDAGDRGLFPNRGGLVTGTLQLLAKDGEPIADRSGVVVFLEGEGVDAPPLPRKPAISQRGRRFAPAVLTVTPGTTVRFPNDDVVFHNVFSLSRGNAFDLGTYGKGEAQERVLAQPGLVKVHCNIHPEMIADVLVLPTPHTAITAADGFWAIPDVAAGDWLLRVWHPLADEQHRALRVTAADTATRVELTVRETRPRAPHPDKHGRSYDRNY